MLELPFPCLPQPLPASKQEARLGYLPESGLRQEAEETSMEDYPQDRRGLLRNPWAGEIKPRFCAELSQSLSRLYTSARAVDQPWP